jgi:energy-coupling factor transport system ATP-binding protein
MKSDIIELKNISFKYKGSDNGLLNNVSLNIKRGETVLLCGASGSGKTTIIRLINGLIPHYYPGDLTGEVCVSGKIIKDTELYELAGTVGTVFQNPRSQFFSVDTDGEIVFGPENIGLDPAEIKKRGEDVVREMKLENLLGKSIFDLSGGEKQKIACASVSALLPEIILLDEPSSNLDWNAIEELRQSIIRWKDQGKTIVISEHRLWYLKDLTDRVLYMERGIIKYEWSGLEFSGFDSKKTYDLKLRPTEMEDSIIEKYRNRSNGIIDIKDDDAIVLKDFYFTYNHKPYFFIKKRVSEKDSDILSLNIPKLNLPRGSVIGIVGRNGTGKSTFLRCVCGLEKDCTGVIEADGNVYKGKQRLKLSYMVMQDVNHQLFTDSVESEVLLSMEDQDKEKCEGILKSLGIIEFKNKHPMALSGGQKQRVAIASAIAAKAKLLLFDEPTSGLDFLHMEKVAELLKELAASGKTVLVSTHDSELIDKCCDHVLCIENGKVGYFV